MKVKEVSKFSIGQKVKYISNNFPELQGVYVITGCYPPTEGDIMIRTGEQTKEDVYSFERFDGYIVESALSAVE